MACQPSGVLTTVTLGWRLWVRKISWTSRAEKPARRIPIASPSISMQMASTHIFLDNPVLCVEFTIVPPLEHGPLPMTHVHNSKQPFGIKKLVACSCTLFGKNLFTLEGTLQPHVDAQVFLVKCFLPEPCAPLYLYKISLQLRPISSQLSF